MDNFDILQQPRIAQRLAAIKDMQDETRRLALIKQLFREIQAASFSIVTKLDEGMAVNNLDEVTASFHNELKNNTAKLLGALKDLKLSNEQQAQIAAAVQKDSMAGLQDEFQTIRVKKNRDRVEVINLDEIAYPSEMAITNLGDIEAFFKSLEAKIESALKIDIPAPQVNVAAPVVHVPESSINMPEVNLDALTDEMSRSFKKVRDNNKSNPLFVRLVDLQGVIDKLEEVRQSSREIAAFGGGPNQIFLKDVNGNIVSPASDPGDALKAFANIAASTTDGAIVTAVVGRKIRVVAVAAVCAGTATNITFNSKPGGSGTAISCLFANGANGGEVLGYNPKGWFDTNTGEGLTATTGGGSTTGVQVNYFLV